MKRVVLILLLAACVLLIILLPNWVGPAGPVPTPDGRSNVETPDTCAEEIELLRTEDRDSDAESSETTDEIVERPDGTEASESVSADKPEYDVELAIPDWANKTARRHQIVVRLYGKVVDHNNLPVMGAEIFVDGYAVSDLGELPEGVTAQPMNDGFDETRVGVTDADGRFDVKVALPVGFPDLGFAELDVLARTRLGDSAVVGYDYYDDKVPTEISLKLPELGGVEGRVVDGYGSGVENAVVHVFPPDRLKGKPLTFVRTDAAGAYRIVSLKPGKYALLIRSREWVAPDPALTVEVFPAVISPVDEIEVSSRRRLSLSVMLDGEAFSGETFIVTFFRGEEEIGTARYYPRRSGGGEIADPPADATRMVLKHDKFEPLEVILPDLTEGRLYDLGTYHLLPTE